MAFNNIPEPIEYPSYVVWIQPLASASTYGSDTNVSDLINSVGLSPIMRQLDSYQSSIGVFKYSNMYVTGINQNGYFNDGGSFFTHKRDLAKVQIYFYAPNGASSLSFSGIVNEAGVAAGTNNETVSLLVTAPEAVLGQVKVDSGDIADSDTFEAAIESILNKTAITNVMGFDATKINVSYNGTIDVASALHDLDTKTALDQLLQASNSVFYLDSAGDMVVASRDELADDPVTFYGAEDIFGRDNIQQFFSYTGGYQRTYNYVTVNDQSVSDSTSISNYGLRKLDAYQFDFITNNSTETAIANTILTEFKNPKKECTIKVKIEDTQNIDLLRKVVLNLGQSSYNNIDITTAQTFKIIGITEYPSNYTADIRLREI